MKKLLMLSLLLPSVSFATVDLYVNPLDATLFATQKGTVTANFRATITNTTNTTHIYRLNGRICPTNSRCEEYNRWGIAVKPYTTFTHNFQLTQTLWYHYAGTYDNYADITILGMTDITETKKETKTARIKVL